MYVYEDGGRRHVTKLVSAVAFHETIVLNKPLPQVQRGKGGGGGRGKRLARQLGPRGFPQQRPKVLKA